MVSSSVRPEIPRGPIVTGGFALATALGATQTWAHVLFVSVAGTDADRGIITLVTALVAASVCAWRAFFGLRNAWYFTVVAIMAGIALIMPVWFYADIISQPEDDTFGNIIVPAWGLFFTVTAAAGLTVTLAWQLVGRPEPQLREWFSSDLPKFLAVGAVSFIVNQGALVLFYEHLLSGLSRDVSTPLGSIDLALLAASAIAVEIAIIARFVLNDAWTFRSRRDRPYHHRLLQSNLGSLGSPLISLLAVNVLTPVFGISYLITNALGIALGLAWNWAWSTRVVWRRTEEPAA